MRRQSGFVVAGWMYLVGAIAVLAMLAGLFAWVDAHWETSAGVEKGKGITQAKWDKANKDQRDREAAQAATASTTLETGNAKAKVVYRTIREQVDKIVEREVYRNICFDADGLVRVNAALVGGAGTAPGQPDRALSRPLTTLRWERSLGAAQVDRGG